MELPVRLRDWNLGLELADDAGAADWVVAALRPWERPRVRSVWIASFVPDTFEAYARILHPARGPSGDVRWADLSARTAVAVGPETGFGEVRGLDPARDQRTWDQAVPSDGSLPERQLRALGRAVGPFTSTPETCFYCVWVGYGMLGEHPDLPLVRLPHREHFLLTGPLARMSRALRFDDWEQSPTMWWPADRAWFVATEVDGYSTYAGGSAACIDGIIGCPDLETMPVDPETAMDPGPYG
jgi:hypothetical protein